MTARAQERDVHAMARAEREALTELLRGLSAAQWASPSSCPAWSVRDVAAHVISYDALSWPGVMGLMARARLDLDRANAIALRRMAAPLFEGVPWGTDAVLAATLDIARRLELDVRLLELLHDVDRPEDLPVWERASAADAAGPAGQCD